MARIVCISDTHGWHRQVELPEGDVLVCAGDLCSRGILDEVAEFDRWLEELPHPHKIVIAGNHDWCFQRQPDQARRLLRNAIYLMDQEVTVAGLKFYGSPWQPEFFDWAFNLPRGRPLRDKWDLIPSDVDVLITHGPPIGILDANMQGVLTGCEELLPRVQELKPKLHVFGHIHEAYGQLKIGPTLFVNASSCDLKYDPVHPPIVVDL